MKNRRVLFIFILLFLSIFVKELNGSNLIDFNNIIIKEDVSNDSAGVIDGNLKEAINKELNNNYSYNVPLDYDLKISDMEVLTGGLNFMDKNIKDISGLEYAKNVSSINLNMNYISDITPIKGMVSLEKLYLKDNNIEDISPIKHLNKLTDLSLDSNNIKDISSLENLDNLMNISLSKNNISNIYSLRKLNNLLSVDLSENQISDLSSLKGKNILVLNANNQEIVKDYKNYLHNDLVPFKVYDQSGGLHEVDLGTPALGVHNYHGNWNYGTFSGRVDYLNYGYEINSSNKPSFDLDDNKSVNLHEIQSDKDLKNLFNVRDVIDSSGGLTVDDVKVDQSNIDYDKSGIYKVLFSLTDTESNTITKEANLEIIDPIIYMPDDNLKKSINEDYLSQPGDADITQSQMEILSVYSIKNNEIKDITGLEYATNLTYLEIINNKISDISPLSSLINLTTLNLSNNQIIDISPLSNLVNLKNLNLSKNQLEYTSSLKALKKLDNLILSENKIRDINSLGGLTNLTTLNLSNNQINDINSLSSLTSLTTLNLSINKINNISSLSGLINLIDINLYNNQVNDLNPLSGLINLDTLYLSRNQINDITPLSTLINLKELYLSSNEINNISSLTGLTNLKELYLDNNEISDINTLSGLTNLIKVDLSWNQINDFRALKDLTLKTTNLGYQNIKFTDQIYHNKEEVPEFIVYDIDGTEIPITDFTKVKTKVKEEGKKVTYKGSWYKDSSFNGDVQYTYTYKEQESSNEKPEITLEKEKEILLGQVKTDEELINLFDVSGFDYEDRDLTDKIIVDQSNVNYNIDGTYDVKFNLSDSSGNKADEKISKLKVIDDTKPTISSEDNESVNLHESKTNEELIDLFNVKAIDKQDGDLTDKVTVDQMDVDYDTPGIYKVIFSVVDSENKKTSKEVNLEIIDPIINVPDDNLRKTLNEDYFSQAGNDDITQSQMENITGELNLNSQDINNITGLEYAKNITSLKLKGNKISDLTPLSGLKKLKKLDIGKNKISDLTPLSGLINLTDLYLNNNQISDLIPLSGLTNLTYLYLNNNQISDLTPLSGLINLSNLYLNSNKIEKLDGIGSLKNLIELTLSVNKISEIDELSSLTNLFSLDIMYNQISDLTPLSGLTGLRYLYLNNNQISDLRPLKDLSIMMLKSSEQEITKDFGTIGTKTRANFIVYDIDGTEYEVDMGELKQGINNYTGIWDNGKQEARGDFTGTVNYIDYKYDSEAPDLKFDAKASTPAQKYLSDDELKSLFNVSAIDFVEGDLTSDVVVDQSDVNYDVPGDYRVTFSISDPTGNNISKDATLEVKTLYPFISADDIYTNVDSINGIDIENFLLANANINVWESTKKLNDVVVKTTNLTNDSKAGIYEATFEVTNDLFESASTNIKVYVANGSDVIDDNKPYLFANDLKVKKGSTINNADYKAFAFDKQDGDLTSEIKYPKVETSNAGVFEAKLEVSDTNTNKTELIKYVTVTDDSSVVSPDDKVMLSADNIYTNVNSVSSSSNINDFILSKSNAFAKNMVDGSDISVVVDSTTLKKDSTVGAYKATLSATSGKSTISKDIDIYVANGSDIIDDNKPYLFARDLKVKKGSTINNDDYKAFAFDKQDGDITSEIKYPKVETSNAGVFEAKLEVSDTDTNKTELIKHVTVTDDSSVVSPDDKVMLSANNIYTNVNSVSSSSDIDKFIIKESNAFAKNMTDGNDIDVNVDSKTLSVDSKPGVYKATLSAIVGTSITTKDIDIYVVDGNESIDNNKPYLYAENIVVNKDDKVDNKLFNATAFDKQDGDLTGDIIYPTVNTSITGVFPIELSVSDSSSNTTKVTSYVTVVGDDSTISPGGDVFLEAKDFSISELDLNSTTDLDKMILDNSHAYAKETNTGNVLSVDVKSKNIDLTSTPGEYEADITATNGSDIATKKIKINLKDVVIDLSADDIFTNEDILSKQTSIDDFLKTNANVSASESSKKLNDIIVKSTNLDKTSTVGIYDATFEVSNEIESVSKDIKIYVANGSDVVDENKPYLFANDLKVKKGSTINNADYKAFAFDKQDGDLTSEIKYPKVETSNAGVFEAKLEVNDTDTNKIETIKHVTVTDDSSVVSPDDKVMLSADNIYTNIDSVSSSSDIDKFIIKESNAFAKNMTDGSDIDVNVDNTTLAIDSKPGVYEATLSATVGTSITTKDIKIYVVDGNGSIDNDKPYLYAENILVNKGDKVDNSLFNATAFDKQDGDLTGDIIYPTVNTSITGVFPIELSVSDSSSNTTKVTSYVTVKDNNTVISPDGNVFLEAKDFSIDELDLNSTTDLDKMILDNSNAYAKNTNDGSNIDVNVKDTTLTKGSKPGEYKANITAKIGSDVATKKIKVTLKDVVIDLSADDVYTNEDTLSKQTDIDDFLKNNANVNANETIKKLDDISVTTSLTKDSTVGVYDATFEVSNEIESTTKGIKIYVANGSDIIDDNKPYLFANDLKVKKDSTINNADYKAVAFDKQDGDISSSIVYSNVDTSNVGVFEAKLEVNDTNSNKTELIKHVTVTDDSSVVSPDDKVMLSADNIYTNVNSVSSSSNINDFILSKSNAFAKNMIDGSDVSVVVDSTTLKKDSTIGAYKATLSATSGKSTISKDIDIYVANGSDIIDDNKPYLFANDISVDFGSDIDNDLYGAVAFDKEDGDITSLIDYPMVDTSTIGKKVTKLSVSDKLGNSSEVSVNVDVVDNVKPIIVADDSSKVLVNSSLSDADAKKLFNVSVSDNVDNLTIDDVSVDMSSVDLNTIGTYDIVFSVSDKSSNSVTKTSKLNVIDSEVPTINSLDKANIKAKNPLSDDELKSLFKVSASDNYDGDITSYIVVDQTKVNYNAPGIYDVVFYVVDSNGNRADKKVFLKILSNEPPVLKGVEDIEVIDGSDFDPMEGVIAIDKEDGDISNNIEVYSKDLKDGLTQVYNYSIEDSDGNKVDVNRTVKYVTTPTNNKPVIYGVDNKDIFVGETFDPMEGVSAKDNEDDDLTSSISITGSVNNNVIGDYILTYTVSDSDNNIISSDRVITVKDIVLGTDNKPFIDGASDVKVKLGSDFDIMEGINANDVEDGDITDLITVNGFVNTDVIGDYNIMYSVIDSNNNITNVSRIVSVYLDEHIIDNKVDSNNKDNKITSTKKLLETGNSSIYFIFVSILLFIAYFIQFKKRNIIK